MIQFVHQEVELPLHPCQILQYHLPSVNKVPAAATLGKPLYDNVHDTVCPSGSKTASPPMPNSTVPSLYKYAPPEVARKGTDCSTLSSIFRLDSGLSHFFDSESKTSDAGLLCASGINSCISL